MSAKADKIDLNFDASSVDRVNGAETAPPGGVSGDETLNGSVDCDVQVKEEIGGKDGESEGATESGGGVDANNSELGGDKLGIEGEIECVRMDADLVAEAKAGSMGEGADDKVVASGSGGDSVIEPEGGRIGECGQDVSTLNEKETTDMEIDEDRSAIGEPDPKIDVCPGAGSNSGNAGNSGSLPVDCEPSSMELGPGESLPCKNSTASACVSKEESFGGSDSHDENQSGRVQSSTEGDSQNDGKKLDSLSLGGELNPSTNEDEDEDSSDDDDNTELSVSKPEFRVSDIVWAKVRSHPWWPGQIFKPSAATAKAKKYFKKNGFLIAYFGDQTFAWNEESHIKPFRPHFERMENQSSLEEFHHAVDCALEEVSRRMEYALACPCIPKEAYTAVKTQIIDNSGIREEFRRIDGGDRFSNAKSFEPSKLIGFMKGLARSPNYAEISRLDFVNSRAQLLAFNRWKGYTQLPEFTALGIPFSEDVKQSKEETPNASPSFQVDSMSDEGKRSESEDGSSSKRKNRGDSFSFKTEKTLSDFLAGRNLSVKKFKRGLSGKGGDASSSISPSRKRKAADSMSGETTTPEVKHVKSDMSNDSAKKLSQSRPTFRVGASILRVASQLNGSSPIFKNKSPEKPSSGKTKDIRNSISLERNKPEKHEQAAVKPEKHEQAAVKPEKHEQAAVKPEKHEQAVVKPEKHEQAAVKPEKHEQAAVDDSPMAEKIPEDLSEEKMELDSKKQAADVSPEAPNENGVATVDTQPEPADKPSSDSNSEPKSSDQNPEVEADKPVESLNENSGSDEDTSPTALILNFTDLESVPLVENLNKIFRRYGVLNESDTEVLKKSKRARVVFKKRADAETAFSSAGKYSIFGPSLVSYQLKYLPSKLQKASSPGKTKRGRKTAKSGAEGSS